ncbi:MAG: LysE family transporter [Burkholderiales bacterium]
MTDLLPVLAVVGALSLGVVSPGPSFLMVAREAVSVSRAHGLAAALGMGLGGAAFALAALLGLQAVLHAVPALYVVLKVAGGLWLARLGWLIFRGARSPLEVAAKGTAAAKSRAASFRQGLYTQLSNPKTAIVYASVFAALLPGPISPATAVVLLVAVFAIEAAWYAFVAWTLSGSTARRTYLGFKTSIDRTAGVVMVGLGLRLILTARVA